ncbi:MAG TPA: uroporphyrinogen decarboxylase [Pseudogracilibacillus sp.]|nr:uroporphyrinogen decarboxylase [Pseudogracilibacillus sp.]
MTKPFNDTILRAYRGEQTAYTPAWYMRQAGRSQKEYLKIRETHTLFEITHDPEICAYVTRLPVENYGNDAAILYKDIMSPLPAMGMNVEIKSGIGPVIDNPVQTKQDIEQLGTLDPKRDIPYVLETIELLTKEQLHVPLIGFSGAPFTLASYMIEGGPSKTHAKTKAFMYKNEEAWFLLMNSLADMIITYTKAQIEAGVSAIQIFDSWIGALNAEDYRYFIKPIMEKIFAALKPMDVPLILFGIHTRHLLADMNDLPVDVIGLDWRTSIKEARDLGVTKVLQGNLDPALLLADWETIEQRTKAILDESLADGNHVFNLGHGVTPDVEPATLKRLTELIHTYSAR